MKTISAVRYGRRMMAVAVCGAALSTASMLAQDSTGTATQPTSEQQGQMGNGGPGGPGGHERMGERHLQMMTQQLNLTPEQVQEVKAIELDSRGQAKAVHEDTSMAQADKRSKMMAIRQSAEVKIRALLNDDQRGKFDAMQARMQERMRNREGGPDGPSPAPSAQ
jgi:protein CpxP